MAEKVTEVAYCHSIETRRWVALEVQISGGSVKSEFCRARERKRTLIGTKL